MVGLLMMQEQNKKILRNFNKSTQTPRSGYNSTRQTEHFMADTSKQRRFRSSSSFHKLTTINLV